MLLCFLPLPGCRKSLRSDESRKVCATLNPASRICASVLVLWKLSNRHSTTHEGACSREVIPATLTITHRLIEIPCGSASVMSIPSKTQSSKEMLLSGQSEKPTSENLPALKANPPKSLLPSV